VSLPDLLLLGANALYSTAYVASRAVLEQLPPATLALVRLGLGALVLLAACRGRLRLGRGSWVSPGDRWRIAAMGIVAPRGARDPPGRAGIAYGSYSLFGREVLLRHDPLRVTAQSILWGAAGVVAPAALELTALPTVAWSPGLLLAVAYLALVITALGYLVWNWALARVPAPRAAIFLTVQPVLGAALGIALLGEAVTAFTAAGGALIVAGLAVTVRRGEG
jgi:drug/metabolite transporter (DMT)-like permease